MVKGGEIGGFGGGELGHPRHWLGAQWVGLFLGVQSCPEPPGAPWGGAGAELGHCQGGHFERAGRPFFARSSSVARCRPSSVARSAASMRAISAGPSLAMRMGKTRAANFARQAGARGAKRSSSRF